MINSCLNAEVVDTNVDHRKEMIEGVMEAGQREVITEAMEEEVAAETDMGVSVTIQTNSLIQLHDCLIKYLYRQKPRLFSAKSKT